MKDVGEIEWELSKNSNGSTSSDCSRKSHRSKMLSDLQVAASPLPRKSRARCKARSYKYEIMNLSSL